jgi:hypothetical protein
MRAALNQGHFDTEALKELRKLARGGASAEDDDRFRQTSEFKGSVAIEAKGWIDALDWRRGNL